MSAALGRVQMARLEELLARRERVAGWYGERLADIPEIEPPKLAPSTTRMSWFVYVVRFAPQINRDEVARRLEQAGIPARPYFLPIHLQPYMVERFGYQPGDYPITEDLGRRGAAVLQRDERGPGGSGLQRAPAHPAGRRQPVEELNTTSSLPASLS